jgi:DNA polymerase-3 subunit beta
MRFRCHAGELLAAAKFVAGVLPAQATRSDPHRGLLLLDAGGDGIVTVRARGLGTQATDAFEVEVLAAGGAAVVADPLLGLLVGLGEVTIELAGPVVVVRADGRRFQIQTAPNVVPPLTLDPGGCELALTAGEATRHFGRLLRQLARPEPPGPMSGVHINVNAMKLHTAATNGITLAVTASAVPMSGVMPDGGVIVPCETAQQICTLAKGDGVALQITPRLVSAIAGRRSYTSSLLDCRFPKWRVIVPRSCTDAVEVEREEIAAALTRLDALEPRLGAALASWSYGATRIELRLGNVASDFVPATTYGHGRLGLPIKPLLRLFETLPVDCVRIDQGDARAPIRISAPDDEDFIACQAPTQIMEATHEGEAA